MERLRISTGTKWEKICRYSRAVRVGNVIEVSGTTAADGDTLVGEGDIEAQTRFIFEKIGKALEAAGSSLKDVTRTRMYTTDISKWEIVTGVHGEVFKDISPASTLVQVSALVDPKLLIEIEATAIVG